MTQNLRSGARNMCKHLSLSELSARRNSCGTYSGTCTYSGTSGSTYSGTYSVALGQTKFLWHLRHPSRRSSTGWAITGSEQRCAYCQSLCCALFCDRNLCGTCSRAVHCFATETCVAPAPHLLQGSALFCDRNLCGTCSRQHLLQAPAPPVPSIT